MDKVFAMLPESRTQVYDMRKIVGILADRRPVPERKQRQHRLGDDLEIRPDA